ncbi:MAG: type VII toxin-antitoxin system HepT family RNase toxin [Candidatus Anammoxibacter sp.]
MKKEFEYRLVRHLSFIENELKDNDVFLPLTWEEYNRDRSKRRDVERWIENIINSSIDIAKLILTLEGLTLPDTYKEMLTLLSTVSNFDKDKVEKLSKWVRLRNIISHEYLDIRWSSIKSFIRESKELYDNFLKSVNVYLELLIKENEEET